jgi:hypothetical protein
MKNKLFLLAFLFLLLLAPFKAISQNNTDATLQETLDWLKSKFQTKNIPILHFSEQVYECPFSDNNGVTWGCQAKADLTYITSFSDSSIIIERSSSIYGDPDEDDRSRVSSDCKTNFDNYKMIYTKFLNRRFEIPFRKIKIVKGYYYESSNIVGGHWYTDGGFMALVIITYDNFFQDYSDNTFTNELIMPFDWSGENNLSQRINRAFLHLHEFYPPVVEKF